MKKIRLFIVNAMIMTGASLLMNAVGVWFNLYISGKLGASGMGIFQLIMSVYSLAVTFACSGINLAATRLVAEETAGKNGGGVSGAMQRCLCYGLCTGAAAGLALYTLAPFIGGKLLGSSLTVSPLKVMSMSMPLIGMSTALGGYFNAVSRVIKSAAASIFEQLLRITISVMALTYLMPPGLEYACLAITGAGVISEALSFIMAFLLYLGDRRRFKNMPTGGGGFTRRMLGIALPVAVSSYLRTGLTTVKHLLVPSRLRAGGVSANVSLAVFGDLHGVALPVILFPAAFLNSFASLLVPEIARRHNEKRPIDHLLRKVVSLNMLCSMAICGILFSFSREIAVVLSPDPDIGVYVRLLAPVIPIMYLDTAVDCVLKGLDEQVSVMRYNVIDAGLSMLSVYFLLPILGIKGYILVVCFSEVLNFALSLGRLLKVSHFEIDLFERLIKPFLCIAAATFLVKHLSRAGVLTGLSTFGAAAALCLGSAAIYMLLLKICGYKKDF